MYWGKDPRYSAGGFHFCAVKKIERERRRYHSATEADRRTRNGTRVYVGGVYVGREKCFPEGRASVEPLIEALNELKARQRAERAGLGGK